MRTRKNRIIIHIRVTTIELRIRRRVSGVRRQSWYVRLKEDGLQAERQYRNLKVYWNCGYWREMPNRERQPYMRRRQTYCNMVILSVRVKSEGVVNCSDCKCKKKEICLAFLAVISMLWPGKNLCFRQMNRNKNTLTNGKNVVKKKIFSRHRFLCSVRTGIWRIFCLLRVKNAIHVVVFTLK